MLKINYHYLFLLTALFCVNKANVVHAIEPLENSSGSEEDKSEFVVIENENSSDSEEDEFGFCSEEDQNGFVSIVKRLKPEITNDSSLTLEESMKDNTLAISSMQEKSPMKQDTNQEKEEEKLEKHKSSTILSMACENEEYDNGKELLKNKNEINIEFKELNGDISLLEAIKANDANTFRLLVENGTNVNAADERGMTALMIASDNNRIEMIKTLLQYKAEVDAKNKKGMTALMFASVHGYIEIAKTLLKGKANVNAANEKGMTALMFASVHGYIEIAKTLLKGKANVNAADKKGMTALMFASVYGCIEIAETLFKGKANVDAVNDEGMTALILASEMGDYKMVEKLLQYEANIDTANDEGMTALMFASQNGKTYTLKVLLENRANVNAANKKGMTALLLASQNGDGKMISELFKYGKNFQKKDLENALKSAVEAKLIDIIPLLIVPFLKSKIKKQGQKPIELIDEMLGEYYDYRTASTYFDEDGKGKFLNYCDKNGFDDDGVEEELGPNSCESFLADFDENFPYYAFIKDDEKKKYIFDILKNACKKCPRISCKRIS